MIDIKKLNFSYDEKNIFSNFSLHIDDAECVFITGDNGSGKSTLMKILNGLLFSDSGEYTFDDMKISEKNMINDKFSKRFHSKIGYVFQNTDAQLFCSSVEDEIKFSLYQTDMSEIEIGKRFDDMVTLFDLNELIGRAPYTLSSGEKKRVALSSVLITNPDVIMLDEPLASLDKKSSLFLFEILKKLKNAGKTIIIVSHNAELKKYLCDKEINLDIQ